MNKLQQLIEEFCPDGVLFYRIDEICDITRGRVMSKDYIRDNAGDYPVYSSQTEKNGELGKISSYDFDGEYLTWTTDGANAGTVFYRKGKFSVTNVCGLLKVKKEGLLTKYLYYALSIESPKYVNSGMGNPKLMSNVMARIKIPVPPLEVQREIVRILDNFTELTAELTAELTTRQKQYEYYRNDLLNFGKEVEWLPLGTIFNVKNGYTPSKANNEFWEGGTIPWFRMEDIRKNGRFLFDAIQHITPAAVKGGGLFPANSLILSTTATIGEHAMLKTAGLTNQQITNCSLKEEFLGKVNPQFAFYYFFKLGEWCKANINQGGGLAIIGTEKIKQFLFPIPPIVEQERIVNILDRFDSLCNDITIGLPAEIEARQKQYEYYRDKLLTFKELSV